MRFSERVGRAFTSFLPQRYRKLTAASPKEITRTATTAFFLILLISVLSAIPQIAKTPDQLAERAAPLREANLSADITLKEPLVLNERPLVKIDMDKENLTEERLLVNEDGMQFRKPFWQGVKTTPWSTWDDPSELVREHQTAIIVLLLLLLPSVAIALGLAAAAVAAALMLATFFLGRVLTKATRFKIGTKPLLKVCIIATTPFLAFLLLPFFYHRWLLVPAAVYVLLVFLGTWLVGEGKGERQKTPKKESS